MTEETKTYEVIASSPKALALCEGALDEQGLRDELEPGSKYPFKQLLTGESFAIPFSEMKPGTLPSLRSSASSYGKRLNRKFRVFIHNEFDCVEVARIG